MGLPEASLPVIFNERQWRTGTSWLNKIYIVAGLVIIWLFLFSPATAVAEYGDIILNSKADSMRKAEVGDVLFPHWFHRIRYRCSVCHEKIFVLRAGGNDISMSSISEAGEQCGKCHNGMIAWEPLECDRCHSLEPGWSGGPIQFSLHSSGERHPKTLKERALDIRIGSKAKPYSNVIKLASGWHPKALSESGLPLDRYGLVNWAEAVRDGIIDPLPSLNPKDGDAGQQMRDTRILFRTRSEFVADVIFPHDIHSYWLQCDVCHATRGGAIFRKEVGQNQIDMADIGRGRWCGRCHDRVAFPISDCSRCHSHPKGTPVDKDVIVRAPSGGD